MFNNRFICCSDRVSMCIITSLFINNNSLTSSNINSRQQNTKLVTTHCTVMLPMIARLYVNVNEFESVTGFRDSHDTLEFF